MFKTANTRRDFFIYLFLILVTLATYWQVCNNEFVNFDDPEYVTENPQVQAGLTLKGIVWAFTTGHALNWHPLTWISHMIDCQLYGLNAQGHHLTNLLFHAVNTVLLFLVFRRMTGAVWQSAFVAVLFAVHPLHVESVAWVAERKDVLSSFFWILTMWTYASYVENPSPYRYLLTLIFFALGLMAKPMLVTLPFVLLLLDWWPLGRTPIAQSGEVKNQRMAESIHPKDRLSLNLRLLWEKIPLFFLVAVSSVVIFAAQYKDAVARLGQFPINIRLANALVSYVAYIVKMIWPTNLAVLYPHPGNTLPNWQVVGAGLLLVCVSGLFIWAAQWRPYPAVGWLWYIGTLVPVIGIVQVGVQSMADRYMYMPLVGLSIIIAWGVPDFVARWRHRKIWLAIATGVLLLVLMGRTWSQVRYWRDSITLFEHAVNVTANNPVAHYNLGVALAEQGRIAEAIAHYSEAVWINPEYAMAHNNLGVVLDSQGQIKEAMVHYSEALRIKPDFWEAHNNLGTALESQGQITEAIANYSEALRIKPDFWQAHYNLGVALTKQGRIAEAIAHYSEALRIKPDCTEARIELERTLKLQKESQSRSLGQKP